MEEKEIYLGEKLPPINEMTPLQKFRLKAKPIIKLATKIIIPTVIAATMFATGNIMFQHVIRGDYTPQNIKQNINVEAGYYNTHPLTVNIATEGFSAEQVAEITNGVKTLDEKAKGMKFNITYDSKEDSNISITKIKSGMAKFMK